MTRNEFIKKIECGDDIVFTIGSRGYTIITWPEDGPIIGEWDRPESQRQYSTAEEMVDTFNIDGTPLAKLTEMVFIVSYTLVRE
jgi:hypothetical protein